ncbi:Dot/Icm T4SS effector LegP [Corallococcus caeni]|uniref:Dot/Icm T4SS effector LegP n=1 Tax=Corallococcus caeni TaxID=3082388 RepID=A0ABQ6R5F2_9BACT|nr:Dot/Icm T4SS effector LegP [Corallococcus sp. NO1]
MLLLSLALPTGVALAQEDAGTLVIEEGDILRPREDTPARGMAKAVSTPTRLWNYKDPANPKVVLVPYTLSSNLSTKAKAAINAAIADYTRLTCVRFVPRVNQPNYVQFFDGGGGQCYSHFGMRNDGMQKLSVGDYCDVKGVVLHGMNHTLGFSHEISRPDRDRYVTIEVNKVKREMLFYFTIDPQIDTQGLPYDYGSIMHYPRNAFSTDGSRTITTKDPKAQSTIGQRVGLSKLDIQKINKLYKCELPAPAP